MSKDRWVHAFIHTLRTIPRAWYVQEELHPQTTYWDPLEVQFVRNFSFRGNEAHMIEALKAIKQVMFTPEPLVEGGPDENFLQYLYDTESPGYATYDKVDAEPKEDWLDGLRHLTFRETEGERDIRESPSTGGAHLLPLKLRKHLGTEDKPKITSVGDY